MTRLRIAPAVLALVTALTVSACTTGTGSGGTATGSGKSATGFGGPAPASSAAPASAAAPRVSSRPAGPQPTFADVRHGSTTSVVKLYAYDAKARSAVVEPIVFMDGGEFCRRFKIKSTDGRCQLEYTTEDSHLKITVPVSARPRLLAWDDGHGGDCIGSPTSGSVCPASPSQFARWLKENPKGFAVITTENGTVTKLAEMYTP